MSCISNDETDDGVDDEFPDAMLFMVDVVLEWYFGKSIYWQNANGP